MKKKEAPAKAREGTGTSEVHNRGVVAVWGGKKKKQGGGGTSSQFEGGRDYHVKGSGTGETTKSAQRGEVSLIRTKSTVLLVKT